MASWAALQGLGILLVLYIVYQAFIGLHIFIWDPFEIDKSLKNLTKASRQIQRTLNNRGANQLQRIGWYPLGVKVPQIESSQVQESSQLHGPPRAILAMDEAIEGVHGLVVEQVDETVEYFRDGQWQKDAMEFNERVSQAALKTSGNVGWATNAIGNGVSKKLDEYGIRDRPEQDQELRIRTQMGIQRALSGGVKRKEE